MPKSFHSYEIRIYEIEGLLISNIEIASSDAPMLVETQYAGNNINEKVVFKKAEDAHKSLKELRDIKCDSNFPSHTI